MSTFPKGGRTAWHSSLGRSQSKPIVLSLHHVAQATLWVRSITEHYLGPSDGFHHLGWQLDWKILKKRKKKHRRSDGPPFLTLSYKKDCVAFVWDVPCHFLLHHMLWDKASCILEGSPAEMPTRVVLEKGCVETCSQTRGWAWKQSPS